MSFARKTFLAVFLSTLVLGSALIYSAFKFVTTNAELEFRNKYAGFSRILADALTRLDKNTEALMLNAAQVVVAEDRARGLLDTDELRDLNRRLNVTHIFVIDRDGRFIRSTNEDPRNIPNLFSFNPGYIQLLLGGSEVEATPVIKPNPEPKPFKFLSVPNFDRTRIIEVAVRLDDIANTLVEAVRSDRSLQAMALYAPDGTSFGTFAENNVTFESQKAKLPADLTIPVDGTEEMQFFTKVKSSHPKCEQCEVSKTSVNGEYYYVLESRVSKRELRALELRARWIFLMAGLLNATLSALIARFASKKLVKNIELVVARVREISGSNDLGRRISISSRDEISYLSAEFDGLLDRIERSQAKLVEAEKVNSKVEMARVIAHNIRSPIVAIEMMLRELPTASDQVSRVLRGSVSEIKLLADKLKVHASSEAGKAYADDLAISQLSSLVDDVVKQKELEFILKSESSISFLCSDEARASLARVRPFEFRAVISNLLNNAVESYGFQGGPVTISLTVDGSHLSLKIEDCGSGIPKDVFEKLGRERVSSKGDLNRGIGMRHAYDAIQSWSGRLVIESQVNIGTTVIALVPKFERMPVRTKRGFLHQRGKIPDRNKSHL